jgi:chromosome segregation ATPase
MAERERELETQLASQHVALAASKRELADAQAEALAERRKDALAGEHAAEKASARADAAEERARELTRRVAESEANLVTAEHARESHAEEVRANKTPQREYTARDSSTNPRRDRYANCANARAACRLSSTKQSPNTRLRRASSTRACTHTWHHPQRAMPIGAASTLLQLLRMLPLPRSQSWRRQRPEPAKQSLRLRA